MTKRILYTDTVLDYLKKRLPHSEQRLFRANVILLLVTILTLGGKGATNSALFNLASSILILVVVSIVIVSTTAYHLIYDVSKELNKE